MLFKGFNTVIQNQRGWLPHGLFLSGTGINGMQHDR